MSTLAQVVWLVETIDGRQVSWRFSGTRAERVCGSAVSAHAVRFWVSCSDLEITTVEGLLVDEVDDTLESRLAEVKLKLSFEAEQFCNRDVVDAYPLFDKAVHELLHPPRVIRTS